MTYRDPMAALLARSRELNETLRAVRYSRLNLSKFEATLIDEANAVTEQIDRADVEHATPLLDSVRIATPCSAEWNDMEGIADGSDRTRFCRQCDKQVWNLSAMSRRDAEAFLYERAGTATCIRFFRRADGTILNEDCHVGVRKRLRVVSALSIGAGLIAASAIAAAAPFIVQMAEELNQRAPLEATPRKARLFANPQLFNPCQDKGSDFNNGACDPSLYFGKQQGGI